MILFHKPPVQTRLMIGPKLIIGLIFSLAALSAPLFAHHGVAAYDYTKTVTAKGTVTEFAWTNPHCKIFFDVTDDNHNVQHWVVEMHPPNNLLDHGWTRQTLRPGDIVSLSFRPAKDSSTSGLLIDVTLPNGVELHQNLLQLPPGETMTIEQWSKHIRRKISSSAR